MILFYNSTLNKSSLMTEASTKEMYYIWIDFLKKFNRISYHTFLFFMRFQQFSTPEDCSRSPPEYAIDIQRELLKKENADLKSKCERLTSSLRSKDTQMLHTIEKNKELSESLAMIQVHITIISLYSRSLKNIYKNYANFTYIHRKRNRPRHRRLS